MPYRSDHDAALIMNEHLEQDVAELLRLNELLRAENTRLRLIARDNLDESRCIRLPRIRFEQLERKLHLHWRRLTLVLTASLVTVNLVAFLLSRLLG